MIGTDPRRSRARAESGALLARIGQGLLTALLLALPWAIRAACVAGAIAAMWWAGPRAWLAFGGDVAALLPASIVLLPVAAALAQGLSWGGLVAGGVAVAGFGWIVGTVDGTVRSLIVAGTLAAINVNFAFGPASETPGTSQLEGHMNRSSGNILILLVGGVLMIYTAYRSLHVVQATLPPEAQIVGYAALAGLDGALLAWTLFKARSARGDKQNAIATFMICLQLAGITATLIGDTVLTSDPTELTAGYLRTVTLWAVPLIIATNVAATVVVHLVDPAQEIFNAKREVQDEIERQVAEHLRQNAAQIAAQVTPAAADHRAAELLAEFMGRSRIAVPSQPAPAAAPEHVAGTPGANGAKARGKAAAS